MQSKELRAVGDLAGAAIGGIGGLIQETHQAIAHRPFAVLGIAAAPVRLIHDFVAGTSYRLVRQALTAPPRAAAALAARALPAESPPLARALPGSLALGALNGAIGDVLTDQQNPLALPMTIRRRGEDVPTDPQSLSRAYPDAGGRLVVFVHGLCETDDAWRLVPMVRDESHPGAYGTRLREQLGYTPLYLRYNTGLHVSDNGRRLSELLDEVVRGWPVDVEEIALVGHSMGGLVARSACHYGERDGAAWAHSVRHVFCLGSPHLGAPLEKAANAAGYALGRLPETRPLARIVNGRSVGIKDLRFGSCVEDDWCDCDIDEFLQDRCCEVPFLDCATYYFIGATLSQSANSPIGSFAGDLLVRFPSASGHGRKRRVPFEIDNGYHVGGAHHLQLLNHPAVYEQIHRWLAAATAPR